MHAKYVTRNGAFLVPLLGAFLLKIDSKIGATFVLANQNAPLLSSEVYDKSRRFFLKTEFVKGREFCRRLPTKNKYVLIDKVALILQ